MDCALPCRGPTIWTSDGRVGPERYVQVEVATGPIPGPPEEPPCRGSSRAPSAIETHPRVAEFRSSPPPAIFTANSRTFGWPFRFVVASHAGNSATIPLVAAPATISPISSYPVPLNCLSSTCSKCSMNSGQVKVIAPSHSSPNCCHHAHWLSSSLVQLSVIWLTILASASLSAFGPFPAFATPVFLPAASIRRPVAFDLVSYRRVPAPWGPPLCSCSVTRSRLSGALNPVGSRVLRCNPTLVSSSWGSRTNLRRVEDR